MRSSLLDYVFSVLAFIKTAASLKAKQVYEQILSDNRTLFW